MAYDNSDNQDNNHVDGGPSYPTYDQVNNDYNTYLGRGASQDEYNNYWAHYSAYSPTDISGSAEGQAYASRAKAGPSTPSINNNSNDPGSIIDALYKQYGIGDGGNGSGFADRAYWLAHPSEILNGRLAADLAGTGSDQPTGTPGSGPWQNSGRNAPEYQGGGASTPAPAAPPAAMTYTPSTVQTAYTPAVAGTYTQQASTTSPNPEMSAALYKMLLERAQQGTQINPNDPNIKQQVDPYTAQVERARRNYLSSAAESDGQFGNLASETRSSAEKAGQASGLFQSQLIGKELQAKRDEIQNALSQMGTMLTAEQQMALQKELGYLNNSLAKYGIDTNAGLAQQQINSNNDQFGATFGLNSTNQANYWDAIRRGLI